MLPLILVAVVAAAAPGCSSGASPRQISSSRAGAFEAAVTAAASGPVAAWYDIRDGNGEIYIRRFDADGEPIGPAVRLTRSPEESYEASIDAVDDMRSGGPSGPQGLAVAWYDKAPDGTLTGRAGLWGNDGRKQWTLDLPPHTRNPVLRVNGSDVVISWIQKTEDGREQVWLGVWDLGGRPTRAPRPLGLAHRTTWNLNMEVDANGTAWVVFDALVSTRASELFLARADAQQVRLQRLTADDGRESKYPDVALDGDRLALTWYDARDGNTEVYLLVTDASELAGDIDGRTYRVTHTAAESIGAYLAWNGGRIGLAWSDAAEGQHEVYFQPFDAGARPLAPPTRVTSNRTASLVPAIAPWRDAFVLAWSEFAPANEAHGGTSEIAFAIVR